MAHSIDPDAATLDNSEVRHRTVSAVVVPGIVFVGILALAACTASEAVTPTLAPTEPAAVPSLPTAEPSEPTRTPEPGFTLIAPSVDVALPPTREPCEDDAAFVADLTIPDFSQFLPGATLDKRWQIRNTGTCEWGPDYRVVFAEGSAMGAQLEHALYPARPGSEAIVTIPMIAPDIPGDYQGNWQLRNPENEAFGPILFIKVKVIAVPETGDAGG